MATKGNNEVNETKSEKFGHDLKSNISMTI